MKKLKIRANDLKSIGFEKDRAMIAALEVINLHYETFVKKEVLAILSKVIANPLKYKEDLILRNVANALIKKANIYTEDIALSTEYGDYSTFGADEIEVGATDQMDLAIRLPIAISGALMPDAHQGYGLPIGGVLATDNAVIPYGVGVDIGCRMCLSILDVPEAFIEGNLKYLKKELTEHTLFGAGRAFPKPLDHEVLHRSEFKDINYLKGLHSTARAQIGTSGSGNHFVEFGIAEITDQTKSLPLSDGKYLAILSHSGSRGFGASIANHYTKIAMERCKLPKEARHLAWLDLNSEIGQEYWLAMNLAGDYASACHHQIHEKIIKSIGAKVISRVENHHNFAWKEKHNNREVIVHRKGATPAGKGVLGIIPGTMVAPGFIVKGKGEPTSLNSASHGAGRKMSRTQAKNSITQRQLE
ncbi:MAG TPA: RtcB family protein, partial [Cytophagaceae bacterium]